LLRVICIDDKAYPDDKFDVSKFIKKGSIYHIIAENFVSGYNAGHMNGGFKNVFLHEIQGKEFRKERFRPFNHTTALQPANENEEKELQVKAA
jgi:hypothetical protein